MAEVTPEVRVNAKTVKVKPQKLNQIIRAADAAQVTSGPGILRRELPGHTTLRMANRTFGWDFPFAVSVGGLIAIIQPGTVNGVYPTIKKKTIKGTGGAELQLNTFDGIESYVALEITRVKTKTQQLVISTMEIVHVQYLNDQAISKWWGGAAGYPNLPGNKTRYPLARIEQWSEGTSVTQVPYYNLQYFTRDNGPVPRHYFVPA